jgi:hypothetical protein
MKRKFSLSLSVGFISLAYFMSAVSDGATEKGGLVTFTKDVSPIIQKNCQVCHRPGEVAPMSFMNYKEVRPWARSINPTTAGCLKKRSTP